MRWLFALLFVAQFTWAEELWLKVGEVRQVPAPAGKAIRIASRGIIRVIDGDDSVRVVGLKPGVSPMVIGNRNFLVHVALSSQKEFVQALRRELSKMKGVRLDDGGGIPAIEGTLLRFSDWRRIADLAIEHQGDYQFVARALPDVGEQALAHFRKLALEKGFPIVRFRATPQFVATVPQASGKLRELAAAVFKPFGIRVDSTDSELMLEPLVRTRVVLAEISKSDSMDIGIEWPSEYQAKLMPGLKSDDGLMLTLHALEARGKAQILASPNLICRSGGEAKFHAGGEFPIKIFSRFTHDVVWKEHGVLLSVRPEADFNGAISLDIQTEVSMLDTANSVDKIPALKSNTVQSHFDLPGRRTIALSGLLRQEIGDTREGVPFLSDIPVLGALFSSQKFIKRQSELVIFVTPEIYTPDHDEPIEMPKGWIRDAIE